MNEVNSIPMANVLEAQFTKVGRLAFEVDVLSQQINALKTENEQLKAENEKLKKKK